MSVPLPSLLVALGAAVLGAAFVSTDAALGSLTNARLSALLEQDELPHRKALERYRDTGNTMRSAYTVGRVVCAALCAVLVADVVAPWVPGLAGHAAAVAITVAVFAPLTDMTMAVARKRADTWGPRFATYLRPFELLLWPFAFPLERVTRALADRLPEPEGPAAALASAEVEALVDEVERQGGVGAGPAEMIRNVLEFEDARVHEVMIPRSRMEAIEISMPLDDVRRLVADSGHSRYPLYRAELDEMVGILCAKDLFKLGENGEAAETPLGSLVRGRTIFVHEQQKLGGLLREMRQKTQHMAVVVDEFGSISGLITLEDIIEVIVGDIRDEHDEAASPPIVDLGDGRLLANASLPTADLLSYLGIEIEASEPGDLRSLLRDLSREVGAGLDRWGIGFSIHELQGREITRVEVVLLMRNSSRPVGVSGSPPSESLIRHEESA